MIKIIGDKILVRKTDKIKAKALLIKILQEYKKGTKYVIGIGGGAGTGKSEIALILRNLFYKNGISSKIICLDDNYNSSWLNRNKIRQKRGINSVGKQEILWHKLNGIIHNFKKNRKKSIIQRINKFTNSIEQVIFNNTFIDIMIIEGLYACFIHKADLRIYLEGTIEETKAFRLERKKEEQTDFRQLVLQKEYQEVKKSKQFANMTISFSGEINDNRRKG